MQKKFIIVTFLRRLIDTIVEQLLYKKCLARN